MIDLLNELTEIPFDVFWEKYMEVKPGIYSKSKAESIWFYMNEDDRITAFELLSKGHPAITLFAEPYEYLDYFSLPF